MQEYRAIFGENGRIIIPAPLRNIMKLTPGEEIILRYDNNSINILTMKQAVKEAQSIVMQYNKDHISLTSSLKQSRLEKIKYE
jgi:AbrB family looped-hinge helix DNA binding protein